MAASIPLPVALLPIVVAGMAFLAGGLALGERFRGWWTSRRPKPERSPAPSARRDPLAPGLVPGVVLIVALPAAFLVTRLTELDVLPAVGLVAAIALLIGGFAFAALGGAPFE